MSISGVYRVDFARQKRDTRQRLTLCKIANGKWSARVLLRSRRYSSSISDFFSRNLSRARASEERERKKCSIYRFSLFRFVLMKFSMHTYDK